MIIQKILDVAGTHLMCIPATSVVHTKYACYRGVSSHCTELFMQLQGKPRRFYVTHPFHPLFEREFALLEYRQCCGEDRVFFLDERDKPRSLPARWTSSVAGDPLIVLAAERSPFRVDELLEIVILIQGIKR